MLNYNRLQYTQQTLENIIAKTTIPHQIIVVDNGSTDGTRDYLKSMKNKTNAEEFRCIFNTHNLGIGGGRNEGLLKATGDYLMTIDDDILVPDHYDIMLKEACDNIENLGITGINVEKKRFPIKNINGVDLQIKDDNLGGGCLCMPRRSFDKLGFFYNRFVYGIEDVDMYLRVERLKLVNGYIFADGEHIDENNNKTYVALKKKTHNRRSRQFRVIGHRWAFYKKHYKDTGSVYIPYTQPNVSNFDENFNMKIGEEDGYK